MILQTINMRPTSLFVAKKLHFTLWLVSIVSLSFSLSGSGHAIVFSEYSLRYDNEQWILSFDQKTRYLRDAIYATRPDLKGTNLNSSDFLDATANHITANLVLKYKGRLLRIVPQQMRYGGLKFESTFVVEGLPEQPGFLTIKTDGFDVHDHSIILFRVAIENEGYLNYFNQDQRLATFDFVLHRYVFEEISPIGRHNLIFYVILLLVLAGASVLLNKAKKGVNTVALYPMK